MSRGSVASAAFVAIAMLVAGCGSSPTANTGTDNGNGKSPYAKYADLTGTERTNKLLTDARKEGSLDIYTSNTDLGDLVTAFKKAYPDIKVNVYRANSETVLQRVTQEASADKTANDVVDTNDFELDVMAKSHYLTQYNGPAKAGLRKTAFFPGWTAERFNAFVVGWNTKSVPASKRPKTIEELAAPSWKGKISMELGDWDWYASMHTYLTDVKKMSDADVDHLFQRLAANAKVVKGHTVQGELLSSGQFGVAMSVYSHTIDKAAADGAPVAWRPPVQPIILRPNGVALMAKPRHPAAALLWVDWVLTKGQAVIAKSKRIPAASKVPGYTDPIPAGTTVYGVPQQLLQTQSKKWESAYDALLRHAQKGGG